MKTKVGDLHKNKTGREFEVIEVISSKKVKVKFLESGYEVWGKAENLRKGLVKDRLSGTIYGVGSFGEKLENVQGTPSGGKWYNMLSRCYRKGDVSFDNYGGRGVSVCEEWKIYTNFLEWYNKYSYKEDDWILDKDILVENNLEYSPSTCCLVPHEINLMFKRPSKNTKKGVSVDERLTYEGARKYYSNSLGREKFGGRVYFLTREEAEEHYLQKRRDWFVYRANKWKGIITDEVYNAIILYAENLVIEEA